MEGTGPHFPLVGEAARRDRVFSCRIGDPVSESAGELRERRHDFCVVLNDAGILLGRIRRVRAQEAPAGALVEEIMEHGPTTIRPDESAERVLQRMQKSGVSAVLVTSKRGEYLGVARQKDIAALIESHKADRPVSGIDRR